MPEQPADPKSPAEELVDLLVFAPLGIALECLEKLPGFVERGRKQANFAQSIGKMALGGFARRPTPSKPTSAKTEPGKSQTAKTQAAKTQAAKHQGAGNSSPENQSPAVAGEAAAAKPTKQAATKKTSAKKTSPKTTKPAAKKTPAADQPARDTAVPDAEPIPGYASMTARQIIAVLDSLTPASLDALEAAENAGKSRVTVLRAINAQRAH